MGIHVLVGEASVLEVGRVVKKKPRDIVLEAL